MRNTSLDHIHEVKEGLITLDRLNKNLANGSVVVLKGNSRCVAAGKDLLVKVNTNIGVSNKKGLALELEKVRPLSSVGYHPDTIMDLSITHLDKPLYTYIIEEFGGPVGTLPHYLCYHPQKGIDPKMLLEEIQKQAEAGVSWMTLHLTATRDLYERAKMVRRTPTSARGGGIIIRDMYINDRKENILSAYFDEILRIFKKNHLALSIGTVFRPATTVDALDEIQKEEITLQGEYIKEARSKGVPVMMEGLGHASLLKIREYVQIVKGRYDIPFTPLGPLPTDAAVGYDHIASAIGSAYMALLGGADIINSVTREEHTGGIPSCDSIMEGLRAARIAAHSVNIARFPSLDYTDRETSGKRSKNYTCVVDRGLFTESAKRRFSMGCQRCGKECPLLINYLLSKREGEQNA